MKAYNPKEIEAKWQRVWEETGAHRAETGSKKKKFYGLIEFPYPSGQGLHVGHPRSFTAMDIICRKRRMEGFNVLFPIGWDAFGLPAENYAIKTGTHPKEVTAQNIANFTRQLKSIGLSFDWSREINTTDPSYYKWTQWIFLKLFEKNLAYKAKMDINWCTSCNVGLANEEVVDGKCERCGGGVIRKEREQWMLKITEYADRLLNDLETVDYLEKIKKQQGDWIGKSSGAQVTFKISSKLQLPDEASYFLPVYTTRPDTLFGATYMVIAPEHELVKKFADQIDNIKDVADYVEQTTHKSELERTNLEKVKTGMELHGIKAVNPVNNEQIPLFISDYVLSSYGTGAIMAVPAHDERDWDFAEKYGLNIKHVISPVTENDIDYSNVHPSVVPRIKNHESLEDADTRWKNAAFESVTHGQRCYMGDGTLVNSEFLNGLSVEEAKNTILDWLEERELGFRTTQYHLRDWVFSRQRYWGEPIPIVICPHCGYVPVPENELPIELPEIREYQTTETGDSPLSLIKDWVMVTCPSCKQEARRETDTMPQWAGSSWYFLRYVDPSNDTALASKEALAYWTPIDWYNGGMEHTTLHLLYSRFWHKFLFDIGVVPTSEPYAKRTSHGMILGEDGEKMSKSRGNVVNPDDIVNEYGADTFRVYEMFMGPFDQATPWSTQGVVGVRRFIERIWNIGNNLDTKRRGNEDDLVRLLHKTIKQVTAQIETMDFNTCVSALMILVNKFHEEGANKEVFEPFLKILSPFAPHLAEELWFILGHKESIAQQAWPVADPTLVVDTVSEISVQVNGKIRAKIMVEVDETEEAVKEKALSEENVKKWVDGKEIKKFVYVKGRIVNIVI